MNAAEAKRLTDSNIQNNVNIQLKEIRECIRTAVGSGKYQCSFTSSMFTDNRKRLENEGYAIINNASTGFITTISWN